MKRIKTLDVIPMIMFGPALLIMWYCNSALKAELKEQPRLLMKGPLFMVRIFARRVTKHFYSGIGFGLGIMLAGSICGAVLNDTIALGALIGFATVIFVFNVIPLLFPAPSVIGKTSENDDLR